jgi:hypothetical protein
MSDHQFEVGQQVRLMRTFADRSGGTGDYEVLRQLPQGQDGERHYRIKGADKLERAVGESQLRPIARGI